jgi:esterase/lipase superfamily enzyme
MQELKNRRGRLPGGGRNNEGVVAVQRDYFRWHSPSLGKDMEGLTYGHGGAPVLIFPTSMGRFFENEDMGMIGALRDKIEAGYIQVYCVDSVDSETWYNYNASPDWRIGRHLAYDSYLSNEVLPFINSRNNNGYLIVTGCSFGAFQAANFAWRHPRSVHKLVAMSGRYNMRNYFGGYFDENLYYNSPLDYIGGMSGGDYRDQLQAMEIKLVVGEWDLGMCMDETRQMHELLNMKGVGNSFEVWPGDRHDWPYWCKEVRNYI